MDYPLDMSVKPEVTGFFDPLTHTISYIVKDPSSNACAIIDNTQDNLGIRCCQLNFKLAIYR